MKNPLDRGGAPNPAGQAANPASRADPVAERAGMKNPLDRVRVPRHNPRNVEGRTGAYQYYLKARARARAARGARACAARTLCFCLTKALVHLRKQLLHESWKCDLCRTAHSPFMSAMQMYCWRARRRSTPLFTAQRAALCCANYNT
jgi:hypothetical protein